MESCLLLILQMIIHVISIFHEDNELNMNASLLFGHPNNTNVGYYQIVVSCV